MLRKHLLRWTPRVLSIALTIMLLLLSFDVFEEGVLWTDILIGFLMHNIPTLIMIGIIILSWKFPIIGAFSFVVAGITYAVWILNRAGFEGLGSILILGLPAIITGVLYGLDTLQRKDEKKEGST